MRKVKTFEGKRHAYDTDKATEIARKNVGTFGDPAGYEEVLYQTKGGLYFTFGQGGADSPYPEPDIHPASKQDAEAFEA